MTPANDVPVIKKNKIFTHHFSLLLFFINMTKPTNAKRKVDNADLTSKIKNKQREHEKMDSIQALMMIFVLIFARDEVSDDICCNKCTNVYWLECCEPHLSKVLSSVKDFCLLLKAKTTMELRKAKEH